MTRITTNFTKQKGDFTSSESYGTSAAAGEKEKTVLEIPSDVIWAWNWKESMPNAVISQLTTFVSLWAIEIDYEGYSGEKNKRAVNYWKDLLNTGYELSSQVKSDDIEFDDIKGNKKKLPPRIMPINRNYTCKIDGTPVKYIPALPNISQVLTKDAKGGVGLDRISIDDQGGGAFEITLSLKIQNPYELMEQSSFWRFFVPGQSFLLTTGWQDDGKGYYNPLEGIGAEGHSDSGVLRNMFKQWPTKRIVPPIVDPATGMLNKHFFNISTKTKDYYWPAFGFWQSYVLVLKDPSFTLDGSLLSGSLKFQTYGMYAAKQILTGDMTAGITKFMNDGEQTPAIQSEVKMDFDPESKKYDPDGITKKYTHYIKLTTALKAMAAAYNTALIKSEESTLAQHNKLIFYSDDDDVKPGDIIDAVVVPGTQTVQGPCNFYLGIPKNADVSKGGTVEENNGTTTEESKNVNSNTIANKSELESSAFNQVKEKLYQNPDFKDKSIYWMEDDQLNLQQAKSKNKKTISDSVNKIGDLPINYQSFLKWLDERKHYKSDELLEDFVNVFMYNELKGVFRLLNENNFFVLIFSDQYYKVTFDAQKSKNSFAAAMPPLQFREYILNDFRWKYFTLRYGDFQSLVSEASIIRGQEDQLNAYTYRAMKGLSKNLANASTSTPGKGDLHDNTLITDSDGEPTVTQPQTNISNATNVPEAESQKTDTATTPSQGFSDKSTNESSADGGSNASNKNSAVRNDTLRQYMQVGLEDTNGMGIDGAIGSYLKYFYNTIDVKIHGTFGIYPTASLYFVGLFEWLRGFFHVRTVSHDIGPDSFMTSLKLVWLGPDHSIGGAPVLLTTNSQGNKVASGGTQVLSPSEEKGQKNEDNTGGSGQQTKSYNVKANR